MIEFTAEPDTIAKAIEANNEMERPHGYSPEGWNHEKGRVEKVLVAVLVKVENEE